jgi:hypothetical protein
MACYLVKHRDNFTFTSLPCGCSHLRSGFLHPLPCRFKDYNWWLKQKEIVFLDFSSYCFATKSKINLFNIFG